jgi:hypothetical protein
MSVLRVALVTSVIMAGLMGSASSHTKHKHEPGYATHSYGGTHSHGHSHAYPHEKSYNHGHHHSGHAYPRSYRKPPPPPVPGRHQDGRYVLPGGLESVCAGGTPPPCVNGQ